MSVLKMNFISIIGRLDKFDEFVKKSIIQNNFHLEDTMTVFDDHLVGLLPFTEENPYEDVMKKADEFVAQFNLNIEKIPKEQCSLDLGDSGRYIEDVSNTMTDFWNKCEKLQASISEIEEIIHQLDVIKNSEVPLEKMFNLNFIKFRFGKMPKAGYSKLQTFLNDIGAFVIPGKQDAKNMWLIYLTTETFQEKVDATFSSLYFERTIISNKASGTPAQAIETLSAEKTRMTGELKALKKQMEDFLTSHLVDITIVYNTLKYLYEAYNIRKYAAHTKGSFYLAGWIAQDDLEEFLEEINNEPDVSYTLESSKLPVRTNAPTRLKNIAFFRPFESLVKMYGLPSFNEIDPTPFIAITYTLMFGIMFGDVGQGAIIAMLGWLVCQKFNIQGAGIAISAGISSILFGFLYDSVFGIEGVLKEYLHFPITISPMHNTMQILIFAIGLGIVFTTVSMIINIINRIRTKDIGNLFFDKNGIAGMIFYWTILLATFFLYYNGRMIIPLVLAGIFIPIACMFLKEPLEKLISKEKDIFPADKGGFFIESFFEVFDIVLSFVSNTVSFVRVGAFALNHVGLFMAVHILQKMTNGVGSILVLILGNVFIIVLEGVIVAIQGLRLEYYEIFSRFFHGEGRPFVPSDIEIQKKK